MDTLLLDRPSLASVLVVPTATQFELKVTLGEQRLAPNRANSRQRR